MKYLDTLRPRQCGIELLRIGGLNDGAYLVPNDLKEIEACFSPGVNNTKRFEDELTLVYNIDCHMCDYASDESRLETPLIRGRQTFTKKWLHPSKPNSIRLMQWINDYTKSDYSDLMLQMDIEGDEAINIASLTENELDRFRIIIIEMHNLVNSLFDREYCLLVESMICTLANNHCCIHARVNNHDTSSAYYKPSNLTLWNTMEFTFLRKDRFIDGTKKVLLLPNNNDIVCNDLSVAPIYLDESWLADTSVKLNRKKMGEDIIKQQGGALRLVLYKEIRRIRRDCSLNMVEKIRLTSLYILIAVYSQIKSLIIAVIVLDVAKKSMSALGEILKRSHTVARNING